MKLKKKKKQKNLSRGQGEEGLFTYTEIAIGSVVISLVILTAIAVLRVTELGTVRQKQRQQALNLAKEKTEELKQMVNAQSSFSQVRVDIRFPPTQTPMVEPYNLYPPTTVYLEGSTFIVDPEVRFVQENLSTNAIEPVPTPGTVETPEVSNLIRVRTDVYYGPPAEFIPLPTIEWNDPGNPYYGLKQRREVYSNLVAEKFIGTREGGKIIGILQYQNCADTNFKPVTYVVELAAYQNNQKVGSALSNPNTGLFEFDNLPYGPTSVAVVAAQPVSFMNYCGQHPVTVGPSPQNVRLRLANIPVTTVRGFTVYASPTPGVLWTPEPYPTPPSQFVPAGNIFVSLDDGISKPVTSTATGAFTITNVRATPVPVPTWYVARGQGVSFSGKGFYKHDGNPVTVVLYQAPLQQAVTVWFTDWWGNPIDNGYYPVTVTAVDNLGVTTSAVAAATGSTLVGPLTVSVGNVNFSWKLNDPAPKAYQADAFSFAVTQGMTSSIPAPGFMPVGTAAGTIYGLGVFDYSVFTVEASEVGGCHEVKGIPISWSGGQTFGTFKADNIAVRCVAQNSDREQYNFTVNTGTSGDYSAQVVLREVEFNKAVTLGSGIQVLPKRAYLFVKVNFQGKPYKQGALITAQEGAGKTFPAGLGSGFVVSRYFSTATTGGGEAKFPLELYSNPVTYTVHARIVNPATQAVSIQNATVILDNTHTFNAPQSQTFNF